MIYLSRVYDFAASHRLYNEGFTDEENARIFGKCSNPNGHGHNYTLDVTVKGLPDSKTGMVVDLAVLDHLVQTLILDKVDHKNLNLDVDFIAGIIPTTEQVAQAIWAQLSPHIPAPAALHRIRLQESKNNMAEYYGLSPVSESSVCSDTELLNA